MTTFQPRPEAEYPPPNSPLRNNLYSPSSMNSFAPLNQPQGPPSPYPYAETQQSALPPPVSSATHPRHSIMQETDDELTEDEREEYENGIITFSKVKNWRFWIRREWLWWYIIGIILVILVALMAFFHRSIVDWLTPFTRRMQSIKAGFCIPVAIIFALSFPPLFGNEIVMVLVGVVWGLGKGFVIVAVGTILGEVANYVLFKYWCRGRAKRMSRKSLNYACLSQALQEGGWPMATIVRLSVIPTHFTTAVLAVCGLAFWHFMVALILSLPKQLITVYVGVVLAKKSSTTNSHVVSDCVFAATAVISVGTIWYIYRRMVAVRKKVLIGMRDDLRSKHIATSEPLASSGYAEADMDERSWENPFAKKAVTEPIKRTGA